MKPELELIRDQQKESWNKFSPGWQKWDGLTMPFLQPMGDEIIRLLHPSGKDKVLDIASGTGEPGLTIARMIPEGKVFITDISNGMFTSFDWVPAIHKNNTIVITGSEDQFSVWAFPVNNF